MKKLLSALLACSVIVSAAGCAKNSAEVSAPSVSTPSQSSTSGIESTSGDSAEPSLPVDYSALSAEEIYALMTERSLITTGNTDRMVNVLKRAAQGESITAAYIGGSITEGYMGGTEEIFAKAATDWLGTQFPAAEFTCVNAGISGTPSILGNIRLERDVLAADPDICFVEFAVNDGSATMYKEAYESIVRTLLAREDMAVVLLFTITADGHTCQPHMTKIGEHYGLPMISLPDSMWVEIQEGRMTWEDYSDDRSHPNPYGHKMITDFIVHYYEQVIPLIGQDAGAAEPLPEALFSGRFENMHYIDSEKLENVELTGFVESDTHDRFHNGWMYKGAEDASLKFTLNCKSLQMIYKANNSKVYADADIYIDGEKVLTVSSNQSDGWNNPVTALLLDTDTAAEHTVEIRVVGGENHYFGVMGFGYCD